jgi:YesN/AraC family two-component response regulator
MSVREISEHTGFDEPTNFVKYFKKHSGQTPEKFRKKNKPTQ